MIFKLEFEGDDKDTPQPTTNNAGTANSDDEGDASPHKNDHFYNGDPQEDQPATRSLSATNYRSKPEPQILQQPMAFSYNTGRSLAKSKRVQKTLDHVHKKSEEKQPNSQGSPPLKMN